MHIFRTPKQGAGLIEKVALKFDKKWWNYKIGGADFFGHIDSSGSDSGVDEEGENDDSIFNVFYDIPTPSNSQPEFDIFNRYFLENVKISLNVQNYENLGKL